MTQVLIKNGTYGTGHMKRQITNETFPLVKRYTETGSGNRYVTVLGTYEQGLDDKNCRVKVTGPEAFEYITEHGTVVTENEMEGEGMLTAEQEFTKRETDEQAIKRIADMFEMLNELTDATSQGIVRGMVISGPPGIGKSYGVEKTLDEVRFASKIKGEDEIHEVIKGSSTAIGLYKKLYLNRKKGFVTVLDDCDTVLFDEQSLNLLKAALDSGEKRRLSWLGESRSLANDDIPDTFDFEGSIIFLTNLDFEKTSSKKIKPHLDAIRSRCHYINMGINSQRDQLLRIRQVIEYGMLDKFAISSTDKKEIVAFIMDNADALSELSLRMVIKIAELCEAERKGSLKRSWQELAEMACLDREKRFKMMLTR